MLKIQPSNNEFKVTDLKTKCVIKVFKTLKEACAYCHSKLNGITRL